MTMDDLDAEISYLMNQLEGEPGDSHELFSAFIRFWKPSGPRARQCRKSF